MDGVVIYVARDYSRAIVWCSDQGPLAVARRDALPVRPQPRLACGDFVTFEPLGDGDMRLCGRLTVVPGRTVSGLTDLLRAEAPPARPALRVPALRVVASTREPVTTPFTAVAAMG